MFAGQKKITLRFFRQGLCTWSKLLAGKKCFWHVLNGTEKRLFSHEYSSLTVWGGNKNLFEKKTVFAKPAWRYALVTQPNVFSIALLLILTMVGSTVTRANTIMIFPNLFTFTPLLRSVIQISIGATLNTPAKFVIAISKIAREKLPPASKDWKKKRKNKVLWKREIFCLFIWAGKRVKISFSFCSSKNFFPFVCQSKKSNSLAVDFYFQGNFSMGTERTSLSLSSFTPLSGLLYKKIYIVVTKLTIQLAISQKHIEIFSEVKVMWCDFKKWER